MKLRLISKETETEGVTSFIFKPGQEIQWEPGQYLHYVLQHPEADDRGLERWFTIASAPYEKNIQITTRLAGEQGSSFKAALAQLPIGGEIEADGPKGKFVLREGDHRHVLIAGGIGITPYRSMLLQADYEKKSLKADLLYANNDEHFVFDEELARVQENNPTFNIRKFVGKRLSEADFSHYLKESNAVYYLSGPKGMVENYEGLLTSLGVTEADIMTDYFPGY